MQVQRTRLNKLLASLRSASRKTVPAKLPFAFPPDWDEERYLRSNVDVKAAVERGNLGSGFEHWQDFGRAEGRKYAKRLNVPDWLQDEMVAISSLEPKLFPSRTFFETAVDYDPMRTSRTGVVYGRLLDEVKATAFTHVFLLPWVKASGADVVALHHIRALAEEFDARILVILTEQAESPWLHRVHESARTLHFGEMASGAQEWEACLLLARLLLMLRPAIIHNVNSALGWQIFCRHGAALRSVSRLYASLFCFDYRPDGEPFGYALDLERAHAHLERVFTDNQAFADQMIRMYGIAEDLFFVVHYPVCSVPRFEYCPEAHPKILWAGRAVKQKRPDILKQIAERLPEHVFHVYGSGPLDQAAEVSESWQELARLENVSMPGGYDGFDSLPTENYALFLYTSQWDGMPNVVLEAAAAGLPVLAPDVGGIGELIPAESGFLVSRFDDVDAYVTSIRGATAEPHILAKHRATMLREVSEKHSYSGFISALGKLPMYTGAIGTACSPLDQHRQSV